MASLTKADIAESIANDLGINKKEAKGMVEAFFEELRVALENGHHVKLSGFGNFQLRDKNERPGRNPKTGEAKPVSERRVVTFHPSQKLRDLVELRTSEDEEGAKIDLHETSIDVDEEDEI